MNFFHALFIICLASILTLLIWRARWFFSRRKIGGITTGITVIVDSGGCPAELEQSVKGLVWLIRTNTLDQDTLIVIKNADFNRETAEMARILEKDYPDIVKKDGQNHNTE